MSVETMISVTIATVMISLGGLIIMSWWFFIPHSDNADGYYTSWGTTTTKLAYAMLTVYYWAFAMLTYLVASMALSAAIAFNCNKISLIVMLCAGLIITMLVSAMVAALPWFSGMGMGSPADGLQLIGLRLTSTLDSRRYYRLRAMLYITLSIPAIIFVSALYFAVAGMAMWCNIL